MAIIIDGKQISQNIRKGLLTEVSALTAKFNRAPGLAVIIVGDNPASRVYVKNKIKACEDTGIKSFHFELSETVSETELLSLIAKLNANDEIDGILVQLPLPKHLKEDIVINAIAPEKDVDGFSPVQSGRLLKGEDCLLPCTPAGVIELLKAYNVKISGSNTVIIGRSNIVGKPLFHLLLKENATVTVCHTKTADLASHTRRADIVVAAVGHINALTADMVKEGATVIDVGINRTENGLKGDVEFDNVKYKAALITPVPGGVGPMTITMLLKNTLKAFKTTYGI
jgi:methylenetetrahydrofolate dehydrogenase (NADP+)/methenyltetrahydrofolate cyclohydrolase